VTWIPTFQKTAAKFAQFQPEAAEATQDFMHELSTAGGGYGVLLARVGGWNSLRSKSAKLVALEFGIEIGVVVR
jgi:hypothetical protein